MSIDFLYSILLLLALMLTVLSYLAHRHGCFSKRGWCYLSGFLLFLALLGVCADYPAHFLSSHASATLQSQADSYLFLFDDMPPVPIRVLDEPIAEDRNVAFFDPSRRVIYIKQEYLSRGRDITKTLKHEMVHAWMDWKGIDRKASRSHGAKFQAKLRDVLTEKGR